MREHFHNHRRSLQVRFLSIFLGTFFALFALLNVRYLYASMRYWLVPGTIVSNTETTPSPFPLAQDIKYKPLPDEAQLIIDRIGVNAPLVFGISSDPDSIYKALEQGVVHYSDTVKPGMEGPSVLLGHSSAYPWYQGGYGSVFALLSKLSIGDRFYIRYGDGRFFIFEVRDSIIFNPLSGDARLHELEQTDGSTLILVSCYPVGTNYRRIAIRADLVSQ